METFAVFHNGFFEKKPGWMPAKLYRVVVQRSNPRKLEYLQTYLNNSFPGARLTRIDLVPADAKKVILLYPDAIGLGFGGVEKKVMSKFGNVTVLNGRGRVFTLNPRMRVKLALRRFLEVTFLPEIFLAPVLLGLGTLLSVKDRIVGHS